MNGHWEGREFSSEYLTYLLENSIVKPVILYQVQYLPTHVVNKIGLENYLTPKIAKTKQLFYGYMFIRIHIYSTQGNQVFKDAYNIPKTSPR